MNKVIVTIGPKSIYPEVLKSLIEAGANSFRINLSHSNPTSLEKYFYAIESSGVIPSIDTQGAQLRVEKLFDKSEFKDRISAFEMAKSLLNSAFLFSRFSID